MSFELIFTFVIASAALAIAPGPDNVFVLLQSSMHGKRSGIMVTLGLCTGLLFHTAAVSFGLAAIIQSSAKLFFILKMAGALYLLYLAWLAFTSNTMNDTAEEHPRESDRALYLRGVIMNIANPKVALFFLAFLPQFIPAQSESSVGQIFLLGGIFIVVALLVFSSIAILADGLRSQLLGSSKAQVLLNRVAGAVFVGLALKLMVSERNPT